MVYFMDNKPSFPLPDLEAHLGYWLRRVSNPVSGAFTRALQARQTSVAEWEALWHIHDRQNITPGELAHLLGMTRGAISKVLDRLEKKEWVMRAVKPEDNRVQLLSLTPQGDQILPELAQIADDNDEHFFGCLNSDEQTTLRNILQKLAKQHQWDNVPVD
jgi:DNA-binding MarR family transcriptional regulator